MANETPTLAKRMCYSEEILIEFHLGDRSPLEREQIRAHLNECGRCSATLLDISDFFRSGEESRSRKSSNERTDLEWRDFSVSIWLHPASVFVAGLLTAALVTWAWFGQPAPDSESLLHQQRVERRNLDLSTRIARHEDTIRQLNEPTTEVTTVILQTNQEVHVKAMPDAMLVLTVASGPPVSAARLLNSSNELIWQRSGIRRSGEGFRIAIRRTQLPDGAYALDLDGPNPRRFRFSVSSAL